MAQGTADAAALAAAQDLPATNVVVATAKQYVLGNAGIALSAWDGCTDVEHLAVTPDLANNNECISIDEAYSRVRVKIPTIDVPVAFGGVVNYQNIRVTAAAVAGARLTRDDRIIPATVAASSGTGNICTENGGNNAECDARTSGNFGSFDARRMNLHLPSSNVQQDSLRINYAMGIDHVLSIYGTGAPKVCDVQSLSPCTTTNVSTTLDANHLVPYTGNNVPPLTDGVIENATIGTDAGVKLFCGRLRRPDLTDDNLTLTDPEGCEHWSNSPGPGPAITVLGEKLNGRHVSYWMKSEFRAKFYPGMNPTTTATTSASWATGDAKLDCFSKSYRFDYGGSLSSGHVPQTEFFIDPTKAISSTGVGTEFSLAQAKTYLKSTCGLDSTFVDAKLESLTDGQRFWPMFDTDMAGDPRFGMIPIVGSFPNGGSSAMAIVGFQGSFIYRLYTTSTKIAAIDSWVFEPALIQTQSGIAESIFGYQTDEPIVVLVK